MTAKQIDFTQLPLIPITEDELLQEAKNLAKAWEERQQMLSDRKEDAKEHREALEALEGEITVSARVIREQGRRQG